MPDDPYIELLTVAMSRAYVPYSNFAVGAVIRGESGACYAGANVENAAYPQGWCAEASALSAMVMAGETRLTEVAVMAAGDLACTPCGGCRQKLKEFAAPDARVLVYSLEGLRSHYLLEDLLPHGFGGSHLS